jgi:hypothetical protein
MAALYRTAMVFSQVISAISFTEMMSQVILEYPVTDRKEYPSFFIM